MDFTINQYVHLLTSLKRVGYSFQTFEQFLEKPAEKVVVLRHDVDLRPQNSLNTAQIEHELGIKGSYYFRIVKESNNPEIINKITELGHEIGYHYETMDTASSDIRHQTSDFKERFIDKAYKEFCKNLNYFRTLYPVKTICMHGSPLSKYDNKDIWQKYSYKNLGLIGEPYFDIDFSKVLYLTDTGRRWNGEKVSVRDKVTPQPLTASFRHTKDIIIAIESNQFAIQAMITVHPQRWTDSLIPWTKELVLQNIKNIIKRILIKFRNNN